MASLNPFLNPMPGQKPWVDQISITLKTQIAITIDTPPVSIFEVPKIIKSENPEAYVPQRVGLGPNYHFQHELYHKVEQKKLNAVKRVVKPHQVLDYEQDIVEKVKKIIPLVRVCYELFHDADDNMMAWLLTIDGMFLIDKLNGYSDHGYATGVNEVANDLVMLENQVPLVVLKEIQNALLGQKANEQEHSLESKFRYFCKSHSLFVLSQENIDFNRVNHLLDYMYKSIVNNEKLIPREVDFTIDSESETEAKQELFEAIMQFAGVMPGAQPIRQVIEFIMQRFPEITEGPAADEIEVPSVSELRKVARVEFRLSPKNEGIRNINFVQGKVRYCYLPLMTINRDSEVVLRNLMAYEKLMAKNNFMDGYGLELTEYVDFMCGIIDKERDVELLREQKIIEGDLSDEEIVKLFNGIGKSRLKMDGESELSKTVAQLNMVYESTPRIWVLRRIERRFMSSIKVITVLISVASTLLFFREVFLTVYGTDSYHMRMARFLQIRLSRIRLGGLLRSYFGPSEPPPSEII
ncbi:putative UPF0481 protein At3g02645 [Bidens hawaiensis]|uniref:putative UPF0481 protein At3g02645 n=1 Tax=Bidens hawaiensis TaxID=980011 RepID=UPI00404B4A54